MINRALTALIAVVFALGVTISAAQQEPAPPPAAPPAVQTPAGPVSPGGPAAGPGRGRGPLPPLGPAAEPLPREGARHQSFLEVAKGGNIDLLFVGDSITDWWRQEQRGLPVWNEFFAPLRAANFGIAGDTTQGVLWRMQNGDRKSVVRERGERGGDAVRAKG